MPKIVDHEQRRSEIVAALWQIVADQGFEAVTVRSVAAQAGLSPTTVAEEFSSRTELLIQAYQNYAAGIGARINRLRGVEPGIEQLVDLTMKAIPITPTQRRRNTVWLALLEESASSSRAAEALTEVNSQIAAAITEHLRLAQRAGVISQSCDPAIETIRLQALIDGLSARHLSTSKPSKETMANVLRSHFESLAAE